MARWGKSIVVPLDSLIKEKENTNRPIAARSAGTVGKWGKMGFTSTRTYSLQSIPIPISPAQSPESDNPSMQTNDTPKPKKFFKSRNSTLESIRTKQIIQHLPRAPPSPIRSETHTISKRENNVKIKITKNRIEQKKSTSSEKIIKPKKKREEKTLKPEGPPSRIISRHRKTVNYKEDDDDRCLTPFQDFVLPYSESKSIQNEINSTYVNTRIPSPEIESNLHYAAMEPPIVSSKPSIPEHPPIVLRISKGTSRLISTDSEDVINSPQHEINTVDETLPTTEDLLATLTDEPSVMVQPNDKKDSECIKSDNMNVLNDSPELTKHERIKLVIKTDVLKASGIIDMPEKKPKNKKHKHLKSNNKKQIALTTPKIRIDNNELFRNVVISPTEPDFDSQSSILGSISSKETNQFQLATVEESCVVRSRGSSDVTSDLETSQHSSLVAPPSDIESRLESMMDCDLEENVLNTEPNTNQTNENLPKIEEEPLNDDILKVLTGEEENENIKSDEKSTTLKETSMLTSNDSQKEIRITRTKKDATEPNSDESHKRSTRSTRSNNIGSLKGKSVTSPPQNIKSCTRTRRTQQQKEEPKNKINNKEVSSLDLTDAPQIKKSLLPSVQLTRLPDDVFKAKDNNKEYKTKNKLKRTWCEREVKNNDEDIGECIDPKEEEDISNCLNKKTANKFNSISNNNNDMTESDSLTVNDDEKRTVKLVISKKKGSIFKSRALVADQGDSKKRHIYKHTWDAEEKKEKAAAGANNSTPPVVENPYDDFKEEEESTSKLNRLSKQNVGKFSNETITSVKCDKKAKEYYTVVRNVMTAHQIQEIGEYQEMDDDVEYILDALQPHNPIPTRCLSAIQLASKCMTPAFRMHVRAHGTATKFFKALRDASNDLSLGLCTSTIMFVLSQDTLNMDLDRDTLELMMNLLEADLSLPPDENGLTNLERNKARVKEICEEIKSQGKGTHLNIENISVGTLAMETLLSLTSKRAGEWFKEELRELGGLEHIIKTICDCCHQISDYVVSWTEILLDKLRTIERCLRVLENVSQQNETNQNYILAYNNGNAVNTLFKLYKLCDTEIALYPTSDNTPKENPGVVLREALVPTLKVLINLTHPFSDEARGSAILGTKEGIFDTSFHILLQAPNYIPERCIFELSILVLLLLINLTMHTVPNRSLIMQSHAPTDFGNQFDKVPAIKALIEYFYKCEEQARLAEQNTDAILENPEASNKKLQSQEEVDETVTKLLQKAGHHMEHTMQASYAGILIGHLISDNKENETTIRSYLKEKSFNDIVSVLEKYYNFMNLTASSEATVVSHIKSTKKLIDYYKNCDKHSSEDEVNSSDQLIPEIASSSSISTRSTPRTYKTYSQR